MANTRPTKRRIASLSSAANVLNALSGDSVKDDEKSDAERKLLRNRDSASRYRKRRKEYVQGLEARIKALENQRKVDSAYIAALRHQLDIKNAAITDLELKLQALGKQYNAIHSCWVTMQSSGIPREAAASEGPSLSIRP